MKNTCLIYNAFIDKHITLNNLRFQLEIYFNRINFIFEILDNNLRV